MTRTDAARLKESIDLRELVGEDVKLRNGVGLCPFHREKTGSLRVHELFYKCFGCGAGGDAITWLTKFHQLSFREAVAELEKRSGVSATNTIVRAPREAATLAVETAEWYNGLTSFFVQFLETYPDNDHMQTLYDAHRAAKPADIIAAYRRVRTPWLAAQLRAAAAERDELAGFFRSAVK